MRIPVLMVVPPQEPLVESAMAIRERRPPRIPLAETRMPAAVELDTSFAAVPVGVGHAESALEAAVAPGASEGFAVRGHLEVETAEQIPQQIEGRPLFADPQIQPFPTCGGASPVGNAGAVASKLQVSQLATKGLDGSDVAIAIMDTGINLQHLSNKLGRLPSFDAFNSWSPPKTSATPGKHPVDHGTMCAFDALLAAPKATLVDFAILSASAPGGSISSRTLSVAMKGFSELLTNWAVAFAPGGLTKYKALVVSNSWGIYHPSWDFPQGHPGRFCDNPNHPFNVVVKALISAGADVLFAAGNCGAQCADLRCQGRTVGAIMGSNALQEVVTLAGCDVNDQRVGYSSQGPSIPGMFQQKPDLTTYTHFLGSEAFGAGSPDSGTSAACPVASGCVAALRTRLPRTTTPPANLQAQLTTTARPATGQTGWNGDYGHGILDPLAAATSLGL